VLITSSRHLRVDSSRTGREAAHKQEMIQIAGGNFASKDNVEQAGDPVKSGLTSSSARHADRPEKVVAGSNEQS